ncbi:MAG TPA: hypothetical protein VKE69_08010 [Planctomycetota bacterium]|nr:hypothetical protein [Planctomycetota bacterium]
MLDLEILPDAVEPRFAVVTDDLTLDELYAVHSCYPNDEPNAADEGDELDRAGEPETGSLASSHLRE